VPFTSVRPAGQEEQTRLEVAVGAVEVYWPAVQIAMALQLRSVVYVGAVDWYWLLVQTVKLVQVVSWYGVQPAVLYCVDGHTEQVVQTL
jgi:hypothetical protein